MNSNDCEDSLYYYCHIAEKVEENHCKIKHIFSPPNLGEIMFLLKKLKKIKKIKKIKIKKKK